MSETNKSAYLRFIQSGINERNLDVIDDVFAAEFNPHMGEHIRGPEGERQLLSAFIAGFPDLHFDVQDIFAENEKVVTRWIVTGTHKGDFMGIQSTNNPIEVAGMTIVRFEDGKIVEEWASMDIMGMMQQLGVIPK